MSRVGRELVCTRCDALWDVVEIPEDSIDPARYVCPDCLRPVPGQLELDETRTDERGYDPGMARIPF